MIKLSCTHPGIDIGQTDPANLVSKTADKSVRVLTVLVCFQDWSLLFSKIQAHFRRLTLIRFDQGQTNFVIPYEYSSRSDRIQFQFISIQYKTTTTAIKEALENYKVLT